MHLCKEINLFWHFMIRLKTEFLKTWYSNVVQLSPLFLGTQF